jgi:hypothetical protein
MYYHIPSQEMLTDYLNNAPDFTKKSDLVTSSQMSLLEEKISAVQSEITSHLFYGLL